MILYYKFPHAINPCTHPNRESNFHFSLKIFFHKNSFFFLLFFDYFILFIQIPSISVVYFRHFIDNSKIISLYICFSVKNIQF